VGFVYYMTITGSPDMFSKVYFLEGKLINA